MVEETLLEEGIDEKGSSNSENENKVLCYAAKELKRRKADDHIFPR